MLSLAAFLIAALGVAHSILGERYILIRLFRRDDLPKIFGSASFTVQTLRFAWHITTVAWLGLAAVILNADEQAGQTTLRIIGYTAIVSGLLPLILTRGRHLSWIVMFAIGAILLRAAGS